MYPFKHAICHFGPMMGPVMSGGGSFNTGVEFYQVWDGPSSA